MNKFFTVMAVVALAGQAFAGTYCHCGLNSGEDMCNPGSGNPGKCHPLVVRPMEVPKPVFVPPKVVCTPVGGVAPLVPLPGPCTCTKAHVKPAVVPRPVCTTCYAKNAAQQTEESIYGSSCNSGVQGYGSASQFPINPMAYYPQNPAVAAPADPVSLSIAYKMAQKACHHQEDKLAFGFMKIPKELPPVIRKTNNIPEENLYSLNGQIVELKPVACSSTKSLDEEAADELLALSEEAIEPSQIRKVSLGELGYDLAKIQSAPFIDVPVANPGEVAEEALLNVAKCKDGFVPGGVVFKNVPQPKAIVIQPEIPCDHFEEVPDLPEPSLPEPPSGGGCCCNFYHKKHTKSTQTHNMFLQKLGCL